MRYRLRDFRPSRAFAEPLAIVRMKTFGAAATALFALGLGTPPAWSQSRSPVPAPSEAQASAKTADAPAQAEPAQPNPTPPAQPAPIAQSAPATSQPSSLTFNLVNGAKLTDGPSVKDGVSPAVLRAEVLLDRVHASPGVIDGKDGANFSHALESYEGAKGLKPAATLSEATWSALMSEGGPPVLKAYVLTDADVAGPFFPDLPKDYGELAKLQTIGYRNPSQKIGAKFHMGEDLLAALNPGLDLSKAGTQIVVTDVTGKPIRDKVSKIIVDKAKSQVRGYDRKGRLIIANPATIGSRELPSPSGTYKVRGVAYNPVYYYDPDKNFVQGENKEKLKLPPGPNNPVGTVFIALTKPTYGLHGTPDPSKIDKTASHGCVRMTNWDANDLAHLVSRGAVVTFTK